MTRIISFDITGTFASFKDPSVTTNQMVYYIPSKTAIIGILGAMTGIERSNTLGPAYEQPFIDFFSKIKVGLRLENNPKKITYFTNHRSLKADKTKPVKKEILENPQYHLFVKSSDDILDDLEKRISKNNFVYSPYLGHSYCPAKISGLQVHDCEIVKDISRIKTDGVILDESDSNDNESFNLNVSQSEDSRLVVEQHLHHTVENNKFSSRVLKHWIPFERIYCIVKPLQTNKLSDYYQIKDLSYCLY